MTNPAPMTLAPFVRDWRTARTFLVTVAVGAVAFVIWGRLVDLQSTPVLLLIYFFGFPGLLGLGWFALYKLLRSHFDVQMVKEYLARARGYLLEQAKLERFEHCDVDIVQGHAEALAIQGDTLHVLRAGRYQTIQLQNVLQWDVTAGEPAVLSRTGNLSEAMEREAFRIEERMARAKLEGVFLTTNDRADPLVHIRLLDSAVCQRWAAILRVALAS